MGYVIIFIIFIYFRQMLTGVVLLLLKQIIFHLFTLPVASGYPTRPAAWIA